MASVIYNLGGTDRTLILDTRARLLQPFKAGNWTDLRLSAMVSLTKQSDPNDPTGLAETIGAGEDSNQFYFGFKSSDTLFPAHTNFFGATTKGLANPTDPAQLLDSSGTWLIDGGAGNLHFLASNGTSMVNENPFIVSSRFQDTLSGGTYSGYATLLVLRMVRANPTLPQVDSMQALMSGNFFDNGVPFDTVTSIAHLRSVTLAATFAQYIGPFPFTAAPDAIYVYWPFVNSRMRIHSYVLESYT